MKRLVLIAIISMAAAIAANAQSTAPYWLVGTWSDGDTMYIFNDSHVAKCTNTLKHISDGKFEIDGDFIVATFNNGDEEYFILDSRHHGLCYEGGDDLYKLLDPQRSWFLGKWESPDTPKDSPYYACVIITPQYTQTYCGMWDEEGKTVEQMPKNMISVGPETESIDGSYILDHNRKTIYWVYDFDMEMHLQKVD